MAGDNGRVFETQYGNYSLMAEMTTAGHTDIGEIQKAGTTDQVAILAQFDTLGQEESVQKGTYRLEIHQGQNTWEDVVEVIPESNTGDPAELAKFIVWGMNRCPAKHTLLVLWNHGTGWKDEDAYAFLKQATRDAGLQISQRKVNTGFFVSTAQEATTRGILYDDTSLDFLTNTEMSRALRVAELAADEDDVSALFADEPRLQAIMEDPTALKRRSLSLLGMDACLMAMIEVHYQVRDFAQVMIASQEVEPLNGWPYTEIIQALNADSTMTPQTLGAIIVDEYARSYPEQAITQSAIDLGAIRGARDLLHTFTQAVSNAYPYDGALRQAFETAGTMVRGTLEDPDYVDLLTFVSILRQRYYDGGGMDGDVLSAGGALRDWLRSERGPVIRKAATGKYIEAGASGIAVYLPQCFGEFRTEPSPAYHELDFAATGWGDMLRLVFETT
jgi:hypothetical protein